MSHHIITSFTTFLTRLVILAISVSTFVTAVMLYTISWQSIISTRDIYSDINIVSWCITCNHYSFLNIFRWYFIHTHKKLFFIFFFYRLSFSTSSRKIYRGMCKVWKLCCQSSYTAIWLYLPRETRLSIKII
jgi:hypothetical protein